ncbi:MAG: hypothetical protein ABL971_09785 [Vicinamibacterales bacterium]
MTRLLPAPCATLCAALAIAFAGAAQASAQSMPPPGSGPMMVERVHSGLTVAPEVRFTQVDEQLKVLAGGQAGWVFDQRLMIGGAGYALVNGQRDEQLAYGGVVVEWRFLPADSPIRFGVKGLIGGGTATQPAEVAILRARPAIFLPRRVFVRDDFAVFEPEFTLHIRLSDLIGVTAGASYRATTGAGLLEDRINGAAASLAVHFGGW